MSLDPFGSSRSHMPNKLCDDILYEVVVMNEPSRAWRGALRALIHRYGRWYLRSVLGTVHTHLPPGAHIHPEGSEIAYRPTIFQGPDLYHYYSRLNFNLKVSIECLYLSLASPAILPSFNLWLRSSMNRAFSYQIHYCTRNWIYYLVTLETGLRGPSI